MGISQCPRGLCKYFYVCGADIAQYTNTTVPLNGGVLATIFAQKLSSCSTFCSIFANGTTKFKTLLTSQFPRLGPVRDWVLSDKRWHIVRLRSCVTVSAATQSNCPGQPTLILHHFAGILKLLSLLASLMLTVDCLMLSPEIEAQLGHHHERQPPAGH